MTDAVENTPDGTRGAVAGRAAADLADRAPASVGAPADRMSAYLERAPLPAAVVTGAGHVLVFANAAFRQLSESVGGDADAGVPIAHALRSAAHDGLDVILDRVRHDGVAVRDARLGPSAQGESRAGRATWCCDVWPAAEPPGRSESLVITVRPTRRREDARSRQRAVTERLLFTALRAQDLARDAHSSRVRAVHLAEASRRLGATFGLEPAYATISAVALPHPGAWSIVDIDEPDGSWRRLPIVHPDRTTDAAVHELARHWSPAPGDPLGVPLVAEGRQPMIVSTDIDAVLAKAAHGPDNLRLLHALGVGALLVVPLIAHNRLRGAITFVSPLGVAPPGADDVQLAEELAARCVTLLDGARHYDGVRLARLSADAARARADAARQDAEHANQVKTSFLTSMSHELRTPLNAILGYAELIAMGLRGPVTAEQVDALARVRQAGRHLLSLINNVLNFAKLKALHVRFAIADGPVDELLDSAALMVEPQASQKGVAFVRGACPPALGMHGDREKVLQILLNLLSNAIKFTAAGGTVTLTAASVDRRRRGPYTRPVGGAAPSGAVEIRVADTGRGIAVDEVAGLFEPFVQAGRRLTGMNEGTGLGLAISRDLARGMGGELKVESTLGVGSTFTLTMPAATAG